MQNPQQIAKQLVKTRISQSVDVSGAYDNCFFHCYAAHLLTNNLPLPNDLFMFDSVLGPHSNASQLQALFPNEGALSIFDDFDGMVNSSPKSPTHLVEKTLVLGHLLREWFATQLSENLEHRDTMLQGDSGVISIFETYKSFRPMVEQKEDLYTGAEGNIYAANADFLEYFTNRPGVPKQEEYEKYFRQADGDVNKAIKAYWKAEGYQAYCHHIAQAGVKLTFNDVMPVMEQTLRQPFTIYNSTGDTQVHVEGDDMPRMEISIDAQAGHYHLLKTEETEVELDQYKQSFDQYKIDREAVLGTTKNKLSVAAQCESLLVGAICPDAHMPKKPFTLLMEKVTAMQDVVKVQEIDHGAELGLGEQMVAPKIEPNEMLPNITPPQAMTSLADTNYGFVLDMVSAATKKIGYLPLTVAAVTIGAVLTFTTASWGSALAAGVCTGAATFTSFKNAHREIIGGEQEPSNKFKTGL